MSDDADANDEGGGKLQGLKGKAKEAIGWATGDREVEAGGKLDRLDAAGVPASEGADHADHADETVEQAKEEVRRSHGEMK